MSWNTWTPFFVDTFIKFKTKFCLKIWTPEHTSLKYLPVFNLNDLSPVSKTLDCFTFPALAEWWILYVFLLILHSQLPKWLIRKMPTSSNSSSLSPPRILLGSPFIGKSVYNLTLQIHPDSSHRLSFKANLSDC